MKQHQNNVYPDQIIFSVTKRNTENIRVAKQNKQRLPKKIKLFLLR